MNREASTCKRHPSRAGRRRSMTPFLRWLSILVLLGASLGFAGESGADSILWDQGPSGFGALVSVTSFGAEHFGFRLTLRLDAFLVRLRLRQRRYRSGAIVGSLFLGCHTA